MPPGNRWVLAFALLLWIDVPCHAADEPYRTRRAVPNAEGCVSSTLSCGSSATGQIAAGDCTLSDGTRYDIWRFSGSAGQIIEATLTPIDASFTNPVLELDTPAGDASKTPALGGVGVVKLRYLLSSTGSWSLY